MTWFPSVRLVMLCALLAWGSVFASARPSKIPAGVVGYVRLQDWARSRGVRLQRLSGGAGYEVIGPSTLVDLYTDSCEAVFNGVRLCLSFPPVIRAGVMFVSKTDVDCNLDPLLPANRGGNASQIKRIVIDPGHGGRDPGFHNGNKLEKQYTLLLAKEVRQQLLDAGFAASLTREGDTYPTLPERPEIARRRSADLFISLHWNSLPGNKAMKGAQTFCLTPAGARSSNGGGVIGQGASSGNRNNSRNVQLAYHIQRTLLKRLGVDDRGVRRARYWVLRDAIMPAVLIEGGFMSNPSESRNIFLPEYRKTMAAAIVEGIMSYRAHSH